MGNQASAKDKDEDIGCRKLKIEKYPSNISEHQWIPTDFQIVSKQNKEVLMTKNLDRRSRAEPQDYEDLNDEKKAAADDEKNGCTNPIYNIVRLKMKYAGMSQNSYKIGSGIIIYHTLNKSFILTAAHNIVELDEDNNKKIDYAENVWVEIIQNTSNGFKTLNTYCCGGFKVHPKYIKFLLTIGIKESETGYDIAIIEVFDVKNELNKIKPIKIPLYKSKINNNMKIKVIGYPGEEKLRGELYGMVGYGEIKYVNELVQYNKLIAYDIDTTAGQSGSPIFKINNNENKENDNNIYKSFDEIIGIHVAAKQKKKLNFGTILNDEIIKWLYKSINGYCMQYNKYNCNVLLITSSKSKYAKTLNKIYAKCVKTEIMKTKRLYYDYMNEESVNKQHFLFFIQQMFKEIKKSYIIFYCGESDTNGNWIINNNSDDNITLNDILKCIPLSLNNKCKLYIVSDCNNSGNWVTLYNFYYYKFSKHIGCIQASTRENESCNIGTFTSKYSECCFIWYKNRNPNTAEIVGAIGFGGLSALTVGTLYDGVIKQPFHKATKQSQPTSTKKIGNGDIHIGDSRDSEYNVNIYTYDSWYGMDAWMTINTGGGIGSAGRGGFY